MSVDIAHQLAVFKRGADELLVDTELAIARRRLNSAPLTFRWIKGLEWRYTFE